MGSEEEAVKAAEKTGYPVLLKATGGGGGIGIYQCHNSEEVRKNFAASVRQVLIADNLDSAQNSCFCNANWRSL